MKPIACIVLPTYNEQENIPILLPRIFTQAVAVTSHELHVLVVDDHSPDGTAEVVKEFMHSFPHLHLITGEKKGLGDAYKRGMVHAIQELHADVIFEMDADLQHDPEFIPLFITLYNQGFTLVIGSRFLPGSAMPKISAYRKFLSLSGNWLIRVFSGLPRLRDFTSGYRCIKASLIEKCDFRYLSTTGYSFQTSLVFELLRNGARVIEIPILFPDRKYGKSKLSFPDQVEFILNILKLRFRESYEFVRFLIIGISGLVVNLGIYLFLTRQIHLVYQIAAIFALEGSILSNFFMDNIWAFRGKQIYQNIFFKILKYHSHNIAGVLVNYAFLLCLVDLFHIYDIYAYVLGIAIGVVINYSILALLAWKRKE